MTVIVQMTRLFLWDLTGRWEETFQKTAVFTMTKDFVPFSLVSSIATNMKEQNIRVHKIFWHSLWNLSEHVFLTQNGCWKHKVLKTKAIFPVTKSFWPTFLV